MMTGCAPTGVTLYHEARDVYSTMREEVAALQMHVFDGAWDLSGYGVAPEKCGANGYRFTLTRGTPLDDGWWLPQGTTREKADALMGWLHEHGWSDIRLRTYTDGVTSVNIEATKPASHIEDLLITLSAGTANDIVHLSATGICEPGDQSELRDLMFPNGLSGFKAPPSAHPTVEPPFGLATPTPEPSSTPTPER